MMIEPIYTNREHSVGTRLALSDDALSEQLQILIHDMRHEMQNIEALIAFILNDAEAAALPVENLSHKMALQEICILILRRKDTMNDILNTACHYVELTQSPE